MKSEIEMFLIFFMISLSCMACDESLHYLISTEKMVTDIADVLILKYKTKEELVKLKPYMVISKENKWVLDTNTNWKDVDPKMFKLGGGVHIEIDKKTGEILCFTLGK